MPLLFSRCTKAVAKRKLTLENIDLSDRLADKILNLRGLRLKKIPLLAVKMKEMLERRSKRRHDSDSCELYRIDNKIPRLRELRKRNSSNLKHCFVEYDKDNSTRFDVTDTDFMLKLTPTEIKQCTNIGRIVHAKREYHKKLRRVKAAEAYKVINKRREKENRRKITKVKMDFALSQHKTSMLPCLEYIHRDIKKLEKISPNLMVQEFFTQVHQDINNKYCKHISRDNLARSPEPLMPGESKKQPRPQVRKSSQSKLVVESTVIFNECHPVSCGCAQSSGTLFIVYLIAC